VSELAITVVGRDRPGIIADVSGILAGLGFNLTDSTMTLLRGHFAMTLICAGGHTDTDVDAALRPLAEAGLLTMVRDAPAAVAGPAGGSSYLLTVHGADRLGIVAAVTRVLAEHGGNITDLTTRLTGALYLLSAEVDLPSTVELDDVVDRLDSVGHALGVRVSLRPAEADVL
jgi:glycine cleavage system transcriptional repressor